MSTQQPVAGERSGSARILGFVVAGAAVLGGVAMIGSDMLAAGIVSIGIGAVVGLIVAG